MSLVLPLKQYSRCFRGNDVIKTLISYWSRNDFQFYDYIFLEIPSAPANLSYNDNTGSLSWSLSNTTIDYYSVTIITSSLIINYTTNETALELSTSLGEYYNNVSAYVRAIACQGQLTGMAASLILNSS